MKCVWADVLRAMLLAVALCVLSGCQSARMTQPARSATEQLLLSFAAEKAIAKADFSYVQGRTVYLEEKYFKSYDQEYALSALRQRLFESGARLKSEITNADFVIEARSAALSEDTRDTLVGIPALQIPVPLAGGVATPEIALYKSERADATAKLALFIYERDSGQHIHSSGALPGRSHLYRHHILWLFNWRSTEVPELSGKKEKKEK